jgi:hypothetical protein
MKRILFTLLLIMAFMAGYSQMQNNGGTITVESGATLVIEGDYTSTGTGSIEIDGSVQLKGDFINNGGDVHSGSTGTLTLNGTTAQEISGSQSTTFACNVTINNAAGVSLLTSDETILGNLTFTNGILNIGSRNLTLGAASALTRTSGHVNASGAGELRKNFSAVSTYTMPVGDASNYTPVTVAFNSGTFGGAAYVGTRVLNTAHPNLPTTSDYLNRYWDMSSNDITAYSANLTYTFVPGDVVGTAANLYTVKYLGNDSWKAYSAYAGSNQLLASNVDGFSDWTGSGKIALTVDLKAYLQGAYDAAVDEMRTDINGVLPLDQPFSGNPSAVWYYEGTESVGSIPSADITDWALVELRHAATPGDANSATVLGRAAGFITKDGSIVGLNGTTKLNLDAIAPFTDNLYAIVYQQNHLGIMSNIGVTDANNDGLFEYDFTTGSGQVYGGTAGYKLLETGVWGLVGGDGTGDGNIYTDDITSKWTPQYGGEGAYYSADYNLDGNVYTDDVTGIWTPNYGIEGPMPASISPDLSNVPLKYSSQIPKK